MHVGVQLGAATDGPAERVDVFQPFLSGQRTHDPLEGSGFQTQASSSFCSSRNLEVDGEHKAVNLIRNLKGSLRIPRFPQERCPLFCTLEQKDAASEVGM